MRWQAIIAVLAVLLILAATGYTAYNTTTVLVPDYGGTYIEGIAGGPHHINPLLSTYNDADRDLVALLFNGLTRADEHENILPDLAEKWDISPDGLTYTFHLRTDVSWHDGEPFSADDVVFTINLLRAPDSPADQGLTDLWRSVEVERAGPYTVRFTLTEPFAPFLSHTTVGMLPAHLLKDVSPRQLPDHSFSLHPIGTGLFKVSEVNAERVLLLANDSFYGGRPYLDSIEFMFYPDYAAVLAAYGRGEVLGIGRIPPEQVDKVLADEQVQLFFAPLSAYGVVFLNLEQPVFQEVAVRQALLWATDRQAIIDRILHGQAMVANGAVMPSSWAYEAHTAQYTYDPAAAEALLEQAGWVDQDGDGVREKGELLLEFTLLTNDDSVRVQIINELSRQWAQVGIRAIPQTAGVAGVVRDFLAPRNYDAILYEWERLPADPDPYPQWHSTQKAPVGQNFVGYSNEQADLLMEEARRTLDPQRRAVLYRELQRMLADDVPALPLYHPICAYAVHERVYSVQVPPMHDRPDRFRTILQWYMATRRVLVSEAPFWERKLT